MKIRYNPAVDLCCAMLQYAHWNEIAEADIPGYRVSPELEKWYRSIKSEISGILDNDFNYLIRNFLGLIFLPVELALTDGIDNAADLIDAFRSLPPEGLPERLFATYSTDFSFDAVKDDPDRIISLIEKAGGTTRKKEPKFFLEFVRRPAAFQARLVEMMEIFYAMAIQPHEDAVQNTIEEQISEDQAFLDGESERFYNEIFRLKCAVDENEAEIYISYYNEIDIIQIDNPFSIIYGRSRRSVSGGSALPLEQVYSLLADESRRSILQLLCRKAWFIRELSDHLKITSATVSYHMSRFASLNLVTYERGKRKRIYYRADIERVEAMLDAVKLDIVGR